MAGAFVARALSECRGHEFSDGVYHGDKLVQGKPTKVYLNFKEADHLIDKSADDAGDIWKNVVNASKEAEKSPSREVAEQRCASSRAARQDRIYNRERRPKKRYNVFTAASTWH